MTGTVSRLNKENGELTLGSQFQEDVILVVADLSRMQVRAEVDENDIVGVKLGDSTRVEIDAYPDTSSTASSTRFRSPPISRTRRPNRRARTSTWKC